MASSANDVASADPAAVPLRFSRLKLIAQSAAHYAAGTEGGASAAMVKGSALHAYLLGGEKSVVVYRDGRRDKRQAAWREFREAHAGKHILIPSELESVERMRDAIERHPRARDLLDDGVQENRIEWTTQGRACAGTPDVVKPTRGRKILVELKSCDSSKPDRFLRRAESFAYHAQLDWYADGLSRTGAYEPGPVTEAFIVAVESRAPHPVVVYRVADAMLRRGRALWRSWLEHVLVCEDVGHYPGYCETDCEWSQPAGEFALDWGDAA